MYLTKEIFFRNKLKHKYGSPSSTVVSNARVLRFKVNSLMTQFFLHFNNKIFYTSCWRPADYNHSKGYATNSRHITGNAVDLCELGTDSKFLDFLTTDAGIYALKFLGLYYYTKITKENNTLVHLQDIPTEYHNKRTNRFNP